MGGAPGDGLDICATGTAPKEHASLTSDRLPARVGRRRTRAFLDLRLHDSLSGPIVHAARVTGEEVNAQLDDYLRGQSVNDDDEERQSNGQCKNVVQPLAEESKKSAPNPLQSRSDGKKDKGEDDSSGSAQKVLAQVLAGHSNQNIGSPTFAIGMDQPANQPQEETNEEDDSKSKRHRGRSSDLNSQSGDNNRVQALKGQAEDVTSSCENTGSYRVPLPRASKKRGRDGDSVHDQRADQAEQ